MGIYLIKGPPQGIGEVLNASLPAHLELCGYGMCNLDRSIDAELEGALKSGKYYGKHSAWDFNGDVWYQDGKFYEEVWIYRRPYATYCADTLPELMRFVNDKHGWK